MLDSYNYLNQFVGTPLQDSDKDFHDEFIGKLQESVREVKASREMGARYMTFEELLKDECEEGARNKVLDLVQKKLAKGQSVEQIADALEETVESIREIVNELSK